MATRAELDSYYTPDSVALRCARWLRGRIGAVESIAEPSVGGGAWVRACRQVWHEALIDRYDLDPEAAGLREDVRSYDEAVVADWLDVTADPWRVGTRQWDLVIGNPPYDRAEEHVAASVERSAVCALLLRRS
jgi:hypothetical protein